LSSNNSGISSDTNFALLWQSSKNQIKNNKISKNRLPEEDLTPPLSNHSEKNLDRHLYLRHPYWIEVTFSLENFNSF